MAEKDQATRLDETVRQDQLKLLFEQAPWAIITSPLAASALAIAIWDVVDGGLVLAWVAVVTCMAILRFGLMVAFKKRAEAFAVRTWERLFTSTVKR